MGIKNRKCPGSSEIPFTAFIEILCRKKAPERDRPPVRTAIDDYTHYRIYYQMNMGFPEKFFGKFSFSSAGKREGGDDAKKVKIDKICGAPAG